MSDEEGARTAKWKVAKGASPSKAEIDKSEITDYGAKFVLTRPGLKDTEVMIDRCPFTIGRDAECDLVLSEDQVSRRHAELRVNEKGYFTLQDLESQNGILFGGRIVRKLNLRDQDHFTIGASRFVFHLEQKRKNPPSVPQNVESEASLMAEVYVPSPGEIKKTEVDPDESGS